jgi:disulfide bond formation protein DsbB
MQPVSLANSFFSLLALALGALVVVGLVVLLARACGARGPVVEAAGGAARRYGLGAAAAVTGVATLGSLYYSEVVGFVPCRLCWFQRIFMYSLAVVALVALIGHLRARREPRSPEPHHSWPFMVALAAIGLPISAYHWLLERTPVPSTGSCGESGPSCAAPYFTEFGFVTLAWMAGTAFAAVLVIAALGRTSTRRTEPSPASETKTA